MTLFTAVLRTANLLMLRITPTHLHWLGPESHRDLCAHGRVEVSMDGRTLVPAQGDDLAVSTGALHLLRTIQADHTPKAPVADHLIPCCGHFMILDPDSGAVVNLGCTSGLNWWVRHARGEVELTLEDGAVHRTSLAEWTRAVVGFADAVDAFYAASPAREPSDEHDASWYRALRDEWSRLRAVARAIETDAPPPR